VLERFFFPAAWLMNRLSYPAKAVTLFSALIVLLVAMVSLYVVHEEEEIALAKSQQRALLINGSLFSLLAATQQYRGSGYLCLNRSCDVKRLSHLEKELEERLFGVRHLSAGEPYFEEISPYIRTLSNCLEEGGRALRSGDETRFFALMTQQAGMLEGMMKYTSLHGGLYRNGKTSSSYLTILLFQRLPRLIERTGQVRDLGSVMAMRKSNDARQIRALADTANALQAESREIIEVYRELSPGHDGSRKDAASMNLAVKTFADTLRRDVIERKYSVSPGNLFRQGDELSARARGLFSETFPVYRQMLEQRVTELQTHLAIVLSALLFSLLLWTYLMVGSYRGIRASIRKVRQTLQKITRGALHARVPSSVSGELKGIVASLNRTIHTLQRNQSFLEEYKRAVDHSAPVSKTDIQGTITYVNEAYEKLSGYSADELIGRTHSMIRSPQTTDAQLADLWTSILNKETYKTEFENVAKDGSRFYVESTIIPILDEKEEIAEFIAIMHDVSKLKAQEKRLQEQLYRDALTGLPNRYSLNERLEGCNDPKMMLINVDNFSTINTVYGESVGDELIRQLASRLRGMLHNEHLMLYRLGSDEFAILADENIDEAFFHEDVIMIAHQLNPAKLRCFVHEISVRVSIGAVIASRQDGSRPLMAMADIALKEAKRRPQSYFFYSESADGSLQLEKNMITLDWLEYGIKNNKIKSHFQPILNTKTHAIEKFESLMRIEDESGRLHYPMEFIDVAKGGRLYAKLTQQMVLQTLAIAEANPEIEFSMNIQMEDILDARTNAFIIEHLRQSTCAERIIFELVESEELEYDDERVSRFFRKVKEQGSKIAIDDFGSGYSNYAYLMKLGVDIVKIDGSLISDIKTNINNRRITKSIINIVHELGMKTVAEFVSDKEIYNTVVMLGVDYVQGTYVNSASEAGVFNMLRPSDG
jgi:PAS domain S-box-containing protein/diguanylate cyclase (GGDEF)-like protein